jgi:hypothetical protein
LVVHAFARQAPAGQATHAELLVAAAPPLEKVPGAHAVAAADPAGQKKPGGQGACCMLAVVADAHT